MYTMLGSCHAADVEFLRGQSPSEDRNILKRLVLRRPYQELVFEVSQHLIREGGFSRQERGHPAKCPPKEEGV